MTDPKCAACGHPRSNHPYRHRFVGPSLEDDVKDLEAKLARLQSTIDYMGSLTERLDETEAKLAKAVEALDDLLEAITAEDRFGDRSLTITGSTANLKWLFDAEDTARATLAEIKGESHE